MHHPSDHRLQIHGRDLDLNRIQPLHGHASVVRDPGVLLNLRDFESLLEVLLEYPAEKVLQPLVRDVRKVDRLRYDHAVQILDVVRVEGKTLRDHVVQHHPASPDVGWLPVVARALAKLWTEKEAGACLASHGVISVLNHLAHPEVGQPYGVELVHKNVFWLDVSVNDLSDFVAILNRTDQVPKVLSDSVRLQSVFQNSGKQVPLLDVVSDYIDLLKVRVIDNLIQSQHIWVVLNLYTFSFYQFLKNGNLGLQEVIGLLVLLIEGAAELLLGDDLHRVLLLVFIARAFVDFCEFPPKIQ